MPRKIDRYSEGNVDVSSVDLDGLQPSCEGPKLSPFHKRKAAIKFIQRLSDAEHDGQAHVFEVSIARKSYALKIVSSASCLRGRTDTNAVRTS